jgi:hypothetical protein
MGGYKCVSIVEYSGMILAESNYIQQPMYGDVQAHRIMGNSNKA